MKKNFLWRAASGRERRAHRRFKCNAVVRLAYKPSITQPMVSLRAVVVDISQGGAKIRIVSNDIPEYFYLVIGMFEYAIGCVVQRKEGSEYAVEFIKEQPLKLVEAFALLSFPMAPLFSLRGLMKNDIRLVTPSSEQSRAV